MSLNPPPRVMRPFAAGYDIISCKEWEDVPRAEPFDLVAEQRHIIAASTKELTEIRFQDYVAFVKRMAAGTLLHEDDWRDVFPVNGGRGEIWETKPFGEEDLARQYHGEPIENVLQVVLLLCHMKEIHEDHQQTLDAQTSLIKEADERFTRGRNFEWGNRPIDNMRREAASREPTG